MKKDKDLAKQMQALTDRCAALTAREKNMQDAASREADRAADLEKKAGLLLADIARLQLENVQIRKAKTEYYQRAAQNAGELENMRYKSNELREKLKSNEQNHGTIKRLREELAAARTDGGLGTLKIANAALQKRLHASEEANRALLQAALSRGTPAATAANTTAKSGAMAVSCPPKTVTAPASAQQLPKTAPLPELSSEEVL